MLYPFPFNNHLITDTILAVILIAAIVYIFTRNRHSEPDGALQANRIEAELLSSMNELNMQANIVKILVDDLAGHEQPRMQRGTDGPRDTDENTGFISEIKDLSAEAALVEMLLSPE